MERDRGLDAVRAIAIFMVVTIHTASPALSLPVGEASWWGALFWASLVRPAVPLFFMCSGALLLSRDIPLKRLYGHNFLRIVILMLFWAMVAKCYRLLGTGFSLAGIWSAVKEVLLFDHESHFYFLHLLLLVYAILPIVRVFVRAADRRNALYALAFWFVTGILLPLLRYFPPFRLMYPLEGWYMLNMAYSSIGYALLGYYLRQYGSNLSRRWYWLSLAAGIILIFAGTGISSLRAGHLVEIFLEGWSLGAMLVAAGLFGLLLTAKNWRPGVVRFTSRLSHASLCIYLIHGVFLQVLWALGFTALSFFPLISIPVIVIIIIALNWLVYEVLSRIPIVRTWLV